METIEHLAQIKRSHDRYNRLLTVALAAALTGWGRNPLYRLCLSWKTGRDGQ